MRTIVKKTIIPEEIIEEREEETITYGCDFCNFESWDDEEVEKHYAENHACREKKEVCEEQFVRFDTEKDMELWADTQCCNSTYSGYYDYHRVRWSGQGWYHIYGESEGCGRGCCTNYVLHLEPVMNLIYDLRNTIKRKQEKLDDIVKEFSLDKE